MSLIFKRCTRDDMRELEIWLSDDGVRRHIFIDDTVKYLMQSENNDNHRMYSVFSGGELIAHLSGERDKDEMSLCLIVKPGYHGRGIGTTVLTEALTDSIGLFGGTTKFSAYIYKDNPESRRCFEKAGFILSAQGEDGEEIYIYDTRRNSMNEVIAKMTERRSVRKYTSEMPAANVIDEIIKAGTYAPSGMNRQETVIVAIKDKKIRDELAKDNAAVMGSCNDPFYGAPVVLVVLAKKSCPTGIYDGSLVMGNLMNAAHSLGVSSCWIHRAKETFEMPKWQEWLKSIGVEGEYEGIGNCILGYCDGEYPETRPRNSGRIFIV